MQFKIRDLLVLIVIVAIILTLGLPLISASREAARREKCANNLKLLGLGIHNYHDTFKMIPPAATGFYAAPRIGWQVRLLAFEQSPVYSELDMKLANLPREELSVNCAYRNDPPNIKTYQYASEIQQPYTMCPDDTRVSIWKGWAQSSYSGNLGAQNVASGDVNCQPFAVAGVHYQVDRGEVLFGDTDDPDKVSGIFSRQLFGPITFADIVDGTSNTFAVGEILADCHPSETGWWDSDGAGNAHASTAVPLNLMTTCANSQRGAGNYFMPSCFDKTNTNLSWGFRSKHPCGANFLMCDGSVEFIPNEINYHIYQQYGSRADSR